MTLNYFLVVPLGFFQLFRKAKKMPKAERGQVLGLFWSAFVGYLGGAVTFLPVYGIAFPQEGMFLLPLYPFVLAYFMIKQKLFDEAEFAQAAHRDKLMEIGVLAASINHEVRNPLYLIKGLAESCLERQKEGVFSNDKKVIESANEAFTKTMQQTDRAMDIIKRLSIFAKSGIESEIKFEAVKVGAVLEDVLALIHFELASHNIAITRDIPQNLPDVRADRRYLEEILFNLLVNATQAIRGIGKSGEIRIAATEFTHPVCKSVHTPGVCNVERDRVVITIADTGPGIPEDKLKDVFRPFYTTREEGTGLGLYITKQLVEKIGGRIDVASRSGEGTVFTVLLPATL
jgi:two-component system NtrC family sensor kinase